MLFSLLLLTSPPPQCFDASLFLMMNEKKPTWTCPVCDSAAKYDDLMIDGYFQVCKKIGLLGGMFICLFS